VTRAEGPSLPSARHAAVNLDNSPQDPAEPLGSPLPQTETQITDTTTGRPVPACPRGHPHRGEPGGARRNADRRHQDRCRAEPCRPCDPPAAGVLAG